MQFGRLLWGEHPIERSCQKRQCLFGKIYEITRSFYSRRLGGLEMPNRIVIRDDYAHANTR
jgi:hypothetical protein